jgi:hypothetical protein
MEQSNIPMQTILNTLFDSLNSLTNLTIRAIKRFIPIAILLFTLYETSAQSAMTLIGGRAMGLGYSSSCLADEWALFNNVAGLAKAEQPAAAFSYDALPAFSSFNRMAALFTMPVKPGVAAFGIYRFGDDLYNEQVLTAGYANTLGLASLGVKINYVQYSAQGFGNARAITVSFGGIANLTPQLSVGAHIVNINQPKLSEISKETLPTLLILGLGIKLSDKVFITSEVEKDLSYDVRWKSGLEYQLNKKVIARTGFNLNPQAGFIGIGLRPKKFALDYAFQYTSTLGSRHQATVIYKFKPKT